MIRNATKVAFLIGLTNPDSIIFDIFAFFLFSLIFSFFIINPF